MKHVVGFKFQIIIFKSYSVGHATSHSVAACEGNEAEARFLDVCVLVYKVSGLPACS